MKPFDLKLLESPFRTSSGRSAAGGQRVTLRLDAGAAARIAGGHDDAARPSTVGRECSRCRRRRLRSAYISDILDAVTETAGEVAAINVGIATLVRDVADSLGLTEEEIAGEFDAMARLGE